MVLTFAFAHKNKDGAEALRALLFGPLAGTIVPIAIAPTAGILSDERPVPGSLLTIWTGRSVGPELIEAGARAPARALAAFLTSLPVGEKLDAQPFVRFLDEKGAPMPPLVELVFEAGRVELRFGYHGAPLQPPPSRDAGGPVDQLWARAVAESRRRLARVIAAATLEGFGVSPVGRETAEVLREIGREP